MNCSRRAMRMRITWRCKRSLFKSVTHTIPTISITSFWGAGAVMGLVYVAAQADLILHRTPEREGHISSNFSTKSRIGLSVSW